ncbi:MAG: DUF6515 family protein [Prolixibacteraceae bacterium]|jgi:hypothetical protein
MKTINYFRQYFPVVIISIVLFASTANVEAQNHRRENKNNERAHAEYKKSDRNERKTANRNWKSDKNYKHEKQAWKGNDRTWDYRAKYEKKYNRNRVYFEHPRYGRVYHRFDHNPVVFRHNHDNYYYYGNHFYTYRRGIGYCVIEPPHNVFFRDLPFGCDRVNINGKVFFRNGDLFFQLSPRGYAIVPARLGIHITARF